MGLPLVISDYRQKKILKRFKITPSSPLLLLSIQVAIYMIYSLIALVLIYLVSALLFGMSLKGAFLPFIGAFFLVMISMFSIGMLVGGVSPNIKIASVLASLLYFPMLIFSGTTLPIEVMPNAMQKIVSVFPLTQGLTIMKNTFLGISTGSTLLPICVMVGVAALCTILAVCFFRWE